MAEEPVAPATPEEAPASPPANDGELEKFAAIKDILANAKSVLVSGHLSPDGDSIGCMIAISRMLRAAGVNAVAAADHNSLGKMKFLKGAKEILPLKRIRRKRFDVLFVVDCASTNRLPPEVRPFVQKCSVVALDHHCTSENFGNVLVVRPDCAAAAELVWDFTKFMGWQIDETIAEALWVAIVTDSGRFAYQATKPETLFIAAELLKYGIDTAKINDIIYCSFSSRAIKLKRKMWSSLHIWKNRRVAEVSLSREDFRAVRATKADAEDGVEIPRSVMKNEIALYFYQIPDRTKETRVSIRTREPWDATVLAAKFGGGGHVRAAGCTIAEPMPKAKRMMRRAVKELLLAGKKPAPAPEPEPENPQSEPPATT